MTVLYHLYRKLILFFYCYYFIKSENRFKSIGKSYLDTNLFPVDTIRSNALTVERNCTSFCEPRLFTEECFQGGLTFGRCVSCGFAVPAIAVAQAWDCVLCEEGYEIDVIFSDCSGYCVPIGTASRPVGEAPCVMSCAQCGFPYHSYFETPSCNETCESISSVETDICYQSNSKNLGSCARCGFNEDLTKIGEFDQCVSCEDGFEINVISEEDCTGTCVPLGSAINPIELTRCKMPCAACGPNFDGFNYKRDPASTSSSSDDELEGRYIAIIVVASIIGFLVLAICVTALVNFVLLWCKRRETATRQARVCETPIVPVDIVTVDDDTYNESKSDGYEMVPTITAAPVGLAEEDGVTVAYVLASAR